MWNQRYDTDAYVYGTEPNEFLKQQADKLPKGRILCLADGEGRNSVYLAGLGYDVTAVDSSDVGLAKAQKLAAEKGVTITTQVADLADYDLGQGQWQGIVSIFCHLPPPLRKKVHGNINAALVDGGVLLLEAYTPDQLQNGTGGPPNAAMMMTAAELPQELVGLQIDSCEELEREVVEGEGHSGTGAVVQLIGVRP
jgi:SAM-dependent methyltransferase